ncbi:hypothetical protein JD844_028108 [Phrynosoma platyrhinos]|uniref:Uncharacterized protein n=1 Tax=Phrynosoma platyrhinos TaxID=52577 RepID=A0ABQ7SHF9_PHRPL|nr:hypothetical protein JD844_028108 [Phrynosoma platyrhinos]
MEADSISNVSAAAVYTKTSSPSSIQIKLSPKIITRRYGLSNDPHLLKVPTVEDDDVAITPYQFHRHAPERISTSPTLRRLRNSTSSMSQVFPLQDGTENTTMGSPIAQTDSSVPVCQHPLICSQSYSSSHPSLCENSLSLREKSPSIDPISFQPHFKDDFCDGQKLQNTTENNPFFLSEGKQNSQECGQELDLHRSTSPDNSRERRHSSVVVSLPGFEMFPGDLLISDSAAKFLYHSASLQCSGQRGQNAERAFN